MVKNCAFSTQQHLDQVILRIQSLSKITVKLRKL